VTSPLAADARRVIHALPESALRERFVELVDGDDDPTRRDRPAAHITASALIVSADLERVLLCLHGRVGVWLQLGGHCEDVDATLADAALREAAEESGIGGLRLCPTPIDLDIHPVACRYGPSLHYDVRFAGIAPPGAREMVSEESHALGWFGPDALPTPLGSATDRLVGPALLAARTLIAPTSSIKQ
jgi:8-oxo-dGTP pyrophosphatase MutT (NUDIX family)